MRLEHFFQTYQILLERYKNNYSSPTQERLTHRHKLEHDLEQLRYLRGESLYENTKAEAALQSLLVQAPQNPLQRFSIPEQHPLLNYYLRDLYLEAPYYSPRALINTALNTEEIARAYHYNAPGIVVIDNFLSPSAFQNIRRFLLSSTIWHDFQRGGYVGSYMPQGCFHPLIFQLASEVEEQFKTLLSGTLLSLVWSYKYGAKLPGVGLHADSHGAVNLNIWLTPDSATENIPGHNGLTLYNQLAPPDWDPQKYDLKDIAQGPWKAQYIPYRANRAIFFHSGLFHASQPLAFKPGYLNRRMNLTLLFGNRL